MPISIWKASLRSPGSVGRAHLDAWVGLFLGTGRLAGRSRFWILRAGLHRGLNARNLVRRSQKRKEITLKTRRWRNGGDTGKIGKERDVEGIFFFLTQSAALLSMINESVGILKWNWNWIRLEWTIRFNGEYNFYNYIYVYLFLIINQNFEIWESVVNVTRKKSNFEKK